MNQLATAFVQLDPTFQALITALVTLLVSYLLLQLATLWPALAEYLGQYKVGIVTWLSGLVFNLLQNVLNQVPATWDTVLALAMRLIVEVCVALGIFSYFRARGVKALR